MNVRRPPSLRARALMLLARREHSRSELRAKLLPLAQLEQREIEQVAAADGEPSSGMQTRTQFGADLQSPEQRVEVLLAWLEAHAYLSEQRFVESRVHVRSARYGNLRIRQEMAAHGVTLDAQTEQQLRDTEFDRARQAWQRKFEALPQDVGERARQARFLINRGFSADVIRRVLRQGGDVED
ncbi:MAG TPA: RecX family transcriptional regulator [Burkholderiaceae bacterium]|nr:RecX family transcriptional regulator [Burkholderiaceae bacterium]